MIDTAFVVPAIVNNYYSRWWWPMDEQPGKNANHTLPWTGRYLDGFNNKITMHAYANPDAPSNMAIFSYSVCCIAQSAWCIEVICPLLSALCIMVKR